KSLASEASWVDLPTKRSTAESAWSSATSPFRSPGTTSSLNVSARFLGGWPWAQETEELQGGVVVTPVLTPGRCRKAREEARRSQPSRTRSGQTGACIELSRDLPRKIPPNAPKQAVKRRYRPGGDVG